LQELFLVTNDNSCTPRIASPEILPFLNSCPTRNVTHNFPMLFHNKAKGDIVDVTCRKPYHFGNAQALGIDEGQGHAIDRINNQSQNGRTSHCDKITGSSLLRAGLTMSMIFHFLFRVFL
jgi:hypothetical protein